MKIGIDITETFKSRRTGAAYFVVNLVEALLALEAPVNPPAEYTFYYRWSRRRMGATGHLPPGHSGHGYLAPGWWPRRSPLDIVHGFQDRVPAWRGPAKVITLFDVMPALESAPHWMSRHFIDKRKKQFAAVAAGCDLVLCISETTKRDFLRFFPCPEERVRVTYPGVSPRFSPLAREPGGRVASRYGLPEHYMLFVGESSPRKNLVRLIQAFTRSSVSKDCVLVIAGAVDPAVRQWLAEWRATAPEARLQLTGYVADGDLPALYAGARAFLFPSLYEGFGLPIIEAMACGVPVLIGHQGAGPEVAGPHAVVVDPYDVESITAGIARVASVSARELEAARRHARTFSWEQCAQQTLAAYQWARQHHRQT